jgi:hypothetical protein
LQRSTHSPPSAADPAPPPSPAAGAALGDPSSPVGAVVRILNNQMQALAQIESRAGQLGAELERISLGARRGA